MSRLEGSPGSVSRVFLGILVGANVPGLLLIAPGLVIGEMFALISLIVSGLIAFFVALLLLMPLYFYVSRRVARLYWAHSLLIGGSTLGLFYLGLVINSATRCLGGSTHISNGVKLCDDGNLTVGFILTHGAFLLGAFLIGAISGLAGWLIAFGPRKIVSMARLKRGPDGASDD